MKIECQPSGMLMANTYVVWDEVNHKGFIVDPGGYSEKTAMMPQKEDFSLEYIILTHGHGDHIGGVLKYKEAFPDVKVVACIHEKEFLLDPKVNETKELCLKEISLEADIYVEDGDSLDIGDMHLEFIHTPGHTPGGMCIHAGDYLFSGDTLFSASIGRTDFPGGDFEAIISSIKNKLLILPDDTQVLPGHMGPTSIEREKRVNPFVCTR